jgi:hypothetical protein
MKPGRLRFRRFAFGLQGRVWQLRPVNPKPFPARMPKPHCIACVRLADYGFGKKHRQISGYDFFSLP